MQKKNQHNCQLLHKRSKTFHCLPRTQSYKGEETQELSTELKTLTTKRLTRPQSCHVLTGTRTKHRPLTSILRRENKQENKKNVVFLIGNKVPREKQRREVFNRGERSFRASSASSTKTRSITSTPEVDRPNLNLVLPQVPGFIQLNSFSGSEKYDDLEIEPVNSDKKALLLQKFRHAVRLVRIFGVFCTGIQRYAEQEERNEYDLYYLRDMLPDNQDKPTPIQESSLYFNKHLFSRDNTLHFPFWARWICALDPVVRSDTEISKLVTLLRGMKSFNKFSREAQWHLCRTMTYARYEKRRIIVRQGHPGFCFYFIMSGTVSVTVTRRDLKTGIHVTNTVDLLEKNDSFGEIALMTPDARRTATVICRERVEVLVVNRETVTEHCPDVFQRDFDEKFNVLREHDLFKRWSDVSLKNLCFESQIKELAHGKLVDPDSTSSEAVYFIIKGKVDMLRRVNLSDVIASKISISLYETRPLPRPASALPGKGKPQIEFVNVGSLVNNDTWDIRSVFTEGFAEPGNILVSAGVRLVKVPKQRIAQLSPLGALDEFRKSFVLSHRSPTVDELHQEYMAAQSWIEYRQTVVQNVLDCKRGNHVAHMASVTKGTSGWGPWPARGTKYEGHE